MSATLLMPCPSSVLAASPQPELRRLKIVESEESVVITGEVSSYYLKQLAQETVRPTADGRKVVNRVAVR